MLDHSKERLIACRDRGMNFSPAVSRQVAQQVDVRGRHELLSRDLQAAKQVEGDGLAFSFGLIGAEHDLELQEIAEPLDLVEVDAGLAHVVNQAPLADR